MKTAADFPPGINRLIAFAVQSLNPKKIILFGSRARGEARKNSDYDLAFVLEGEGKIRWARFIAEASDAPLTLCPIDFVNWDDAPQALQEEITQQGVVLYDRSKAP